MAITPLLDVQAYMQDPAGYPALLGLNLANDADYTQWETVYLPELQAVTAQQSAFYQAASPEQQKQLLIGVLNSPANVLDPNLPPSVKQVVNPDSAHAVVKTTLAAPLAPVTPLKAATGRGSLMSAERFKANFIGGTVGGAVTVSAAGGPVGLVVGAVVGFLGSLFGGLFGGGGDANAAIKQLRDEFVNVANALLQGFAQLARTVGEILKWIGSVIVEFLKTLWDLLKHLVDLLKDLYQKILKPALKAIQDIRNQIIKLYEQWIRPALIILQKVRAILGILKLFHVKFAAKLDTELAQLEAKITAPLFFILRYVNLVANYLNLILTAANVIQRPLFLASLNAYKGSSINLLANSIIPPGASGAAIASSQVTAVPSIQQTSADFNLYATAQAGAFTATTGAADDQFAKAVAQVG